MWLCSSKDVVILVYLAIAMVQLVLVATVMSCAFNLVIVVQILLKLDAYVS